MPGRYLIAGGGDPRRLLQPPQVTDLPVLG